MALWEQKNNQKCAPKLNILNFVNSTEILAPKLLGDQSESEKSIKRKKKLMTLVSEIAILPQKWLKLPHHKQIQVRISSRILLCILWELARGGSMGVTVGVSDM